MFVTWKLVDYFGKYPHFLIIYKKHFTFLKFYTFIDSHLDTTPKLISIDLFRLSITILYKQYKNSIPLYDYNLN